VSYQEKKGGDLATTVHRSGQQQEQAIEWLVAGRHAFIVLLPLWVLPLLTIAFSPPPASSSVPFRLCGLHG
jgi:hypothetical protein